MIYPKDDPEHGIRVMDLRQFTEDTIDRGLVWNVIENIMGLKYPDDIDKIDYVILPVNTDLYGDDDHGGAFEDFINLKLVYHLNSCRYVGSRVFKNCYSLSNSSIENCTFVDSHAFENCSNIQFTNLRKCTSIYPYAFANSGLTGNIDCSNAFLNGVSGDPNTGYNFYNTKIHSIKIRKLPQKKTNTKSI